MNNEYGKETSKKINKKSKKLKPWQILLISIIALPTIIIGAFSENNEEKVLTEDINNEIFNEVKLEKNVARICDGINIIEDCELNGKKICFI